MFLRCSEGVAINFGKDLNLSFMALRNAFFLSLMRLSLALIILE